MWSLSNELNQIECIYCVTDIKIYPDKYTEVVKEREDWMWICQSFSCCWMVGQLSSQVSGIQPIP